MRGHRLDAADIRILDAVQRHGRLSKARLAEIVNLSPSPCRSRLARLEAAGFVRGYRADIALGRIAAISQVAVTVSLAQHRKRDFDRFEECIRATHEIVDCVATGGGTDYIMTVICSTLAAFQEVMEGLLAAEIGIDRYVTYIVTRHVKRAPPNLLRLLAADERVAPGDEDDRSAPG